MVVLGDDDRVIIFALDFACCYERFFALACHAYREIPDFSYRRSLSSFVFFCSSADVVRGDASFLVGRARKLILHPVARGEVLYLSDVSDREDVLVGGTHQSVDTHASAFIQLKAGIPRKLAVRAQSDRKDHEFRDYGLAACQNYADLLLSVQFNLLE